MWVYTTDGFFSITVSDKDSTLLQVRARVKSDLTRFIETIGITQKIVSLPDRDYAHRVFVNREVVKKYMADYIASMTYSNFKNEVAKTDGLSKDVSRAKASVRISAYHDVWGVMYQLQETLR